MYLNLCKSCMCIAFLSIWYRSIYLHMHHWIWCFDWLESVIAVFIQTSWWMAMMSRTLPLSKTVDGICSQPLYLITLFLPYIIIHPSLCNLPYHSIYISFFCPIFFFASSNGLSDNFPTNSPVSAVEAVVLSEKLCSLNRQTNIKGMIIVIKWWQERSKISWFMRWQNCQSSYAAHYMHPWIQNPFLRSDQIHNYEDQIPCVCQSNMFCLLFNLSAWLLLFYKLSVWLFLFTAKLGEKAKEAHSNLNL